MTEEFPSKYEIKHSAMTLRDYFAGQALAGILANNNPHSPEWTASRAYEHADALLKRRHFD